MSFLVRKTQSSTPTNIKIKTEAKAGSVTPTLPLWEFFRLSAIKILALNAHTSQKTIRTLYNGR